MRLLFIFLSTLILSTSIILLIIYIGIMKKPYPVDAGVDERGLAYILLPGMNIILSLASSTIFLNFIRRIRNQAFYSFYSFFVLPIAVTIYFSSPIQALLEMNAIVCLPFFCVLGLNFIFYRRHIKKKLMQSK